jgi:hypothetical protein
VPFHAADPRALFCAEPLRNRHLMRLPQPLPSLSNLPRHPSQALHPNKLNDDGADADMMHHVQHIGTALQPRSASTPQVGLLTPIWCPPLPSRTCSRSPAQHCHKKQPAVCPDAACCPIPQQIPALSQDAQDAGAQPTQACPCPTPPPARSAARASLKRFCDPSCRRWSS